MAGADVVITMVPDSPDVELVAHGRGRHLRLTPSPARSTSTAPRSAPTSRPRVAAEGKAEAASACVDAPVSGGDVGAINATLSIMVGGEEADVADAMPILESVGKTIVHVGPAGAGQTVKAANQLIVAGTIELVAESIVFLEAYGVDMEAAIKVLAGGLAGNQILERKAAGHAQARVRAGLPDRPAPQGHGHRDLRRPRGRRGASRSAR